MSKLILLWIGLIIVSGIAAFGQEVFPSGGAGSYNLTVPAGNGRVDQFGAIGHGNEIYARPGATWQGPFQTHNWWNSGYWNLDPGCRECQGTRGMNESQHMYPLPMYMKMIQDGFSFGYRTIAQQGDDNGVTQWKGGNGTIATAPFDITMHIGDGTNTFYTSTSSVVANYGDWHVKFEQHLGNTTLYTTAAKGNPFVFFDVKGPGIPYFQANNNGAIKVIAKYKNAILVNNYGYGLPTNGNPAIGSYPEGYYAFFFPTGTQLVGPGGSFQALSTIQIGDVISPMKVKLPAGQTQFTMAVMPDNKATTLELYEPHAYCAITDTRFTYNYDVAKHHVTNKFDVTTVPFDGHSNTPGTLQALFRHQYKYSPEAKSKNTGLKYFTARHFMEVIEGNSFTTEMNYYGSIPELGKAANKFDEAHIVKLIKDLFAFSQFKDYKSANYDDYNFFRSLGLWAQAAEIAHQIKRDDLRDTLVKYSKQVIEDFFKSPSNSSDLYQTVYSPKLNMMTTFPNSFYSMFGMYDYHFVVSYLIYATAIVGKYDAQRTGNLNWVNKWKPMVDLMVRNIDDWNRDMTPPANSNDPWFPYLRFFDPYAGHSWFSNMTVAQEAISESVLFATGAMLWGDLTDNKPMRDMGAMLYVTESEAGRQYWFDYDDVGINQGPFKPNFPSKHAGIVREDGYSYSTFYDPTQPNTPVAIHRADLMPITGSSVWLGTDKTAVERDFQAFKAKQPTFDFQKNTWSEELLAYQALYDAKSARKTYEANVFYGHPPAMSLDQMLFPVVGEHWIATLDSVGYFDGAKVQADIPFFSVFRKDTCETWIRHYMMYNSPGTGPDHEARTVHFTDGTCWWLPKDTLITYKLMGPDSLRGITAGPDICLKDPVTLSVNAKICNPRDPSMYYEYSTNNGVSWKTLVDVKTAKDSLTFKWIPPSAGTYKFRAIVRGDNPKGLMCPLQDTTDNVATVVVTNCSCGLTIDKIATSNVTCNKAADGKITITASGGSAPYKYSIDGGITFSNQNIFNGLSGKTYSIFVKDAGTCEEKTDVLIKEPAKLQIIATDSINNKCANDKNGIAVASVSGGRTPYKYNWNDSGSQNTRIANGLSAGVYIIKITDSSACSASDTITITEPTAIDSAFSTVAAHCNQSDGSITITPSGGNPGYTYLWNDPLLQTTSSATGLKGGTYNVEVTDISGCKKIFSKAVVTTPPSITATIATDKTICLGDSAEISFNVAGGTAPYKFVYSINSVNDTLNAMTGSFTKYFKPLNTTVYSIVAISDANGCYATPAGKATITTNPDPIPKIVLSLNDTLCPGETIQLSAGAAYDNYLWSDGTTSSFITKNVSGIYSLEVTKAGCKAKDSVRITMTSPITISDSARTCATDRTGYTVTFKATGGNANTYAVTGLSGTWSGNMFTSTSIPSGTNYSLSFSDKTNCSLIVYKGSLNCSCPIFTTVGPDKSICAGDSAEIKFGISGGVSPYVLEYEINGSKNIVQNSEGNFGMFVKPSVETTYRLVKVTDAAGCFVNVSNTIKITPAPAFSLSKTSAPVTCFGQCDGTIRITPQGGTPPFDYLWSTPIVNSSATQNNLCAGNYKVIVSDGKGCKDSLAIPITEPTDILYSKSVVDAHCGPNGSATMTATGGGSAPYFYKWNTLARSQTTSTATALDSGWYSCRITDVTGCSKQDSVHIKNISGITLLPDFESPGCADSCNGKASVSVQGGTQPYTYNWTPAGTSNSQNADKLCAGNYSVIVVDKNNCQVKQTFTLINPTPVKVVITPPASICTRGPVILNSNATGGTAPYTYAWKPDPSLSSFTSASPNANPTSKTTYSVIAKDSKNCPSLPATITLSPAPKAAFSIDTVPDCDNVTATFKNLSSGTTLKNKWTFDKNDTTSVNTPVKKFNSGIHSITLKVTDAEGCTDSISQKRTFSIPAKPEASFSFTSGNITLFNPEVTFTNYSLNATSYMWTFGTGDASYQESPVYSFQDTGTYKVCLDVKNKLNCHDSICKPIVINGVAAIYIPNAFTPNDDNRNDVFIPKSIGMDPEHYEMLIFNRWGEQIFTTTDINKGWDGTFNDKQVPIDIYIWKIKTREYKTKRVYNRTGHVSIVK